MKDGVSISTNTENETEEQNSFWADVYYHMCVTNCSKDEAVEFITASYEKQNK